MRAPAGGRSPERIEVDRILALPSVEWPSEEDCEIESFEVVCADAFSRGERLQREQVHALRSFRAGTLFAPLGVGTGKTGIGLLLAKEILRTRRKVLLVVPVSLVPGFVASHVPEWRARVGLPFSIHHFAGLGQAARLRLAASSAPGLYVLPYSILSAKGGVELLDSLDADAVVCDEAQKLKNERSAMSRRFLAWLDGRKPAPLFVPMSGSMTTKSILDFHHLADRALKDGSFLPRPARQAYSWSLVIDAGADPPAGLREAALRPLVRWAAARTDKVKEGEPEAERRAFQLRMTTAPGVVASGDERLPCALTMRDYPCGEPSATLRELYRQVEEDYLTPEGEQIDHAIHGYRWLHELSAGIYNALVWPEPEHLAKHRAISVPEAAAQLKRAQAHHVAQGDYHKRLRRFFVDEAEPGLDTPREVGLAISRGEISGELSQLWRAMKDLEFAGMPKRLKKPVRVCDHKVVAALRWAKERKRGIIWAYNSAVVTWIYEVLRDFGLEPLHAPAGQQAAAAIEGLGDHRRGGKGDRIVVASVKAHGVGRNLQAFHEQLFVQFPRQSDDAEQAIGRTHRRGQRQDEVLVEMLTSTEHDLVNRAACLSDSVYVQQLMGSPMRVLYADWDPLPRVYPPEFLREKGADPKDLPPEARAYLRTRFGAKLD